MSLAARLSRLTPALSGKQRAILLLKSLKDQTPENPSWRASMPREQTADFNRLIGLMNACNIYLPLYITTIELRTEELKVRFKWMLSLIGLGMQAWVAQLIPASKRARAEKAANRWPVAALPWDAEVHEHAWTKVAEEMDEGLRLWLVSLWEELRSVDILLEEVAQEFGGEDPLRPIMRGALEKARSGLTALHAAMSKAEPLELKEPDGETMELARLYFENGRRLMERL